MLFLEVLSVIKTKITLSKCYLNYYEPSIQSLFLSPFQDVIDAYREKKWNPNTDDFEQCKNERYSDKSAEKLALKEGCQIYGHLEVNRVSFKHLCAHTNKDLTNN